MRGNMTSLSCGSNIPPTSLFCHQMPPSWATRELTAYVIVCSALGSCERGNWVVCAGRLLPEEVCHAKAPCAESLTLLVPLSGAQRLLSPTTMLRHGQESMWLQQTERRRTWGSRETGQKLRRQLHDDERPTTAHARLDREGPAAHTAHRPQRQNQRGRRRRRTEGEVSNHAPVPRT
jgi:hypothetical protein